MGFNNNTGKESQYLFSGFQASLSTGEEITSGWIDMEGYDKIQVEGRADIADMTLITSSSRVDGGGQSDDIVLTSPATGTFNLSNTTARQRWMKFQWKNNTAGTDMKATVEDVSDNATTAEIALEWVLIDLPI